jgi:hypothetical protein
MKQLDQVDQIRMQFRQVDKAGYSSHHSVLDMIEYLDH